MTPLLMMYTLGHKFMPPSIHAGGLRYHGMSPMVSHALKLGLIEAEAYHQTKVFEAGNTFCAHGRHRARAGVRARDCRGRGGSEESPRSRKETRHSLQPVRPRPARFERLRNLSHRQNAGCLTDSKLKITTHENSNQFVLSLPPLWPQCPVCFWPNPRPIMCRDLKASKAPRCRRRDFISATTIISTGPTS